MQVQSTRRPMWGPRRPAGSLKGQPTVEPHPSAQHPSLAVELASAVTGRAAGMPSRDLGCPRPHYKPRRRGRQARPHVHVHSTRAPLHSRSRWLRYPRFIQRASTQTVRDGSAAASSTAPHPPSLPHRHAIDATPPRRRRRRRGAPARVPASTPSPRFVGTPGGSHLEPHTHHHEGWCFGGDIPGA